MSQLSYLIPPYEGELDETKIRKYVEELGMRLDLRIREFANIVSYRTDLEGLAEIRRAIKEHDEHRFAARCLSARATARRQLESITACPSDAVRWIRDKAERDMKLLENSPTATKTGVHSSYREPLLSIAAYLDELTAGDPPAPYQEAFAFCRQAGQIISDLIPPPTFPCETVVKLSETDMARLADAHDALERAVQALDLLGSRAQESGVVRD